MLSGPAKFIAAALLIVAHVGCANLTPVRICPSVVAHSAWNDYDTGFITSDYSDEFGAGWRSGYYDVLTGGDGRPPVIPPERFWQDRLFRKTKCDQQDWLTGFTTGANHACLDGLGMPLRPNLYRTPIGLPSYAQAENATEQVDAVRSVLVSQTNDLEGPRIRLLGINPILESPLTVEATIPVGSSKPTTTARFAGSYFASPAEPQAWPGALR